MYKYGNIMHRILNVLCLIITLLAGWLYYEFRTAVFPANHIVNHLSDKKVCLIAQIIRDPDIRVEQTFLECKAETLIIIEPDTQIIPVVGKVRISIQYPANDFEYGDRIKVYSSLYFPKFPENPGDFEYGAYLQRQGIYGVMNIHSQYDIAVINKTTGNLFVSKIAMPIKRFIKNAIDSNLSQSQAGFLKAITIGEQGLISEKLKEYFRNTGTIHILVVSGSNVAIIALMVFLLLGVFRCPMLVKQILTAICLLIYMAVTDFQYPIIRATIMTLIGMIALTTERITNMYDVIMFAGLVVLLVNPQSLFDPSSQLSFIVVLAIVYLYPKLNIFNKNTKWRIFQDLFFVSLSAQIGITPIIACYFSRLPLVSIIANLFIVPLAGLSMTLAFTLCICNLLPWQFLTHIVAGTNWLCATIILKIVEFFANIPYSYMWVKTPSLLLIVFIYVLLISITNWRNYIYKRVFIYGLLIGLNVLVWSKVYKVTHPQLKITCLDCAATLIQTPQGKNILVDGGIWTNSSDAGEDIVSPFLHRNGIRNLDILIVTNPKIYKIGGLKYIANNFKIKEFMAPDTAYPSWLWVNLLENVESGKIDYKFTKTDFLKLSYDNYEFIFPMRAKNEVLWIENKKIPQEKLLITYGKTNVSWQPQLNLDKEGAVIMTTDGKTATTKTMRELYLKNRN